jgi:hypothetical protein
MPVPTIDPLSRNPADIATTDRYPDAAPVWVHIDGVWCAGVVEFTSALAATVSFGDEDAGGGGVGIFTARYLLPRVHAGSEATNRRMCSVSDRPPMAHNRCPCHRPSAAALASAQASGPQVRPRTTL